MNDIYDNIKQELLSHGYVEEDGALVHKDTQTHTMIVNGRPYHQQIVHKMIVRHIDDGWIENMDGSKHEDLAGLSLTVSENGNEEHIIDVWVRDYREFVLLLNQKIQ